MSARTAIADNAPRLPDRLAAEFVLVVLGLATLFFWMGIPLGGLWLLSQVTDSWNGHFLLSMVLIPATMALFSPTLFWLNGLYLRVTGAWSPGDEKEVGRRRLRGPLEMFLYLGMAVAVAALFVWFFFFAKYPPEIVW
jgi:hypothetical protein